MKKVTNIIHKITAAVSVITHVSFLAIMVIIVLDVILRKAGGSGITGAYEIVQVVLAAGVFAGFAYTQSEHGHVHVTLLISHFPQKVRFLVYGILAILSTAGAFLAAYGAYLAAVDNYKKFVNGGAGSTGVIRIPYYPFYIIEIICMVMLGVALAWDMIKSFIAIGNPEVAEEIQSTWT